METVLRVYDILHLESLEFRSSVLGVYLVMGEDSR